jgi:DsbC/DsbD-like thiol-disulfide interchange protein
MKSFTLTVLLSLVCAAQLGNQGKSKGYVTTDVTPTLTLRAGETGSAELRFRVNPGYHVNSHNPGSPLLIPTELDFQSLDTVKVGKITYPKGEQLALEFSPNEKLSVYTGDIATQVPVTVAKNATAGQYSIKGELKYQACNDRSCFPPKNLPVEITVVVKK